MNTSIPLSGAVAEVLLNDRVRHGILGERGGRFCSNRVLPDGSIALSGQPGGFLRHGITLVEMLVALAVTLLMMGAVVTVFGFIGDRVTDSRAMIETNDRLRSASHRLREDLSNITVDAIPWQRPEEGNGYLEILEGPARDARDAAGNYPNPNSPQAMVGDFDDVLMFTARSADEPYRGKFNTTAIESNTAEVIWYMRPNIDVVTSPPTYLLCRRQMLIVPAGLLPNAPVDATFHELYDVSARVDRNGQGGVRRIENTLGDLTKRENRFLHNKIYANNLGSASPGLGYPWPVRYSPNDAPLPRYSTLREGEDVVLSNVLSFDVQVFDPTVENRFSGTAALEPTDPGYAAATVNNTSAARGAYIDLGDALLPGAPFGVIPPTSAAAVKSLLAPRSPFLYSTYDTWSFHYEHDGIQQTTFGPDKGTNGLDDPMTNPGVDDMSERETSPPYPYALRGLRVKIRVYEPGTKQVREISVVQSFVPE